MDSTTAGSGTLIIIGDKTQHSELSRALAKASWEIAASAQEATEALQRLANSFQDDEFMRRIYLFRELIRDLKLYKEMFHKRKKFFRFSDLYIKPILGLLYLKTPFVRKSMFSKSGYLPKRIRRIRK